MYIPKDGKLAKEIIEYVEKYYDPDDYKKVLGFSTCGEDPVIREKHKIIDTLKIFNQRGSVRSDLLGDAFKELGVYEKFEEYILFTQDIDRRMKIEVKISFE